MNRCAIIGHKGQDGRILAECLRQEGHIVIGVGRGDLDLLDQMAVEAFLRAECPDHIYYLAAYHHSSEDRLEISDAELFRRSFDTHLHGVVSFLEGIRQVSPTARLFYAASSHVFGRPGDSPQTETTPFSPENIYGISKAAGVEACRFYRRNHRVHASCGILYNHESQYRSEKFVSQKIIQGALAIARGERDRLTLGNLNAAIDWGYAPDFVRAMKHILALDSAGDFIVATGETHTVGEFAELAFSALGLDWRRHVEVNPALLTKTQSLLVGDSTKLKAATGWQPTIDFAKMVMYLLNTQQNAF
jgi:GDPmannose 4,6-dehydratase